MKKILSDLFGDGHELSTGELLFFKIFELVMVFYGCQLAWTWAFYTLKITDVVLPLGIAEHIDISFMHDNYVPIIFACLFSIISVLAYFRKGPSWMYLLAAILLHFLYSGRYSIGEIPHSANFVGMSVLAFGIAFAYSKDRDDRISLSLGLIIFFVGLGYTTAAISKFIATGLHWSDGRHLWMWMTEKSTDDLSKHGVFVPNFLQNLAFSSIPIATVILTFGILTELFGFLVWFKKLRPIAILFIIGLHVGIFLTMKIWFGKFITELLLLGFPWAVWMDRYGISEKVKHWKLIQT